MINRETVAKELYETYCTAVGGVAFNGDKLPDWEGMIRRSLSTDMVREMWT